MDAIKLSKEKILLEFSKDELMLIGNALNEVCHGIKMPEFDLLIGKQIKQLRLDAMTD